MTNRRSVTVVLLTVSVRSLFAGIIPLNPIEQAFANLMAPLRKAGARTRDDLWQAIAAGLDRFDAKACRNDFRNAGYAFDKTCRALERAAPIIERAGRRARWHRRAQLRPREPGSTSAASGAGAPAKAAANRAE